MENDRRKRLRIGFSAHTRLILPGKNGQDYNIEMIDISMSGMSGISENIPLKFGEQCIIKIIIPGKSSRLILEACGKISRNDGRKIAIEFENDLEWWAVFSIYKPYGFKDNDFTGEQ